MYCFRSDSWAATPSIASSLLYVIVANKAGLPIPFTFNYSYVAPSATPTATRTSR